MVKRVIMFVVIAVLMAAPLALTVNPAGAQDDARVGPTSVRYDLVLPEGWVASATPAIGDFQGLLPSEALTIASDKDTLATVIEQGEEGLSEMLESVDGLDGGAVMVGVFPGPLVRGVPPSTLYDGVMETNVEPVVPTWDEADMSQEGLEGKRFDFTLPDGTAGIVSLLFDENDNLLIILGLADSANTSDVVAAIESIEANSFTEEELVDPENLTETVEILPDTLAIDIAPGWWTLRSDDVTMTAPNVDFFEGMLTGGGIQFSDYDSVVFFALPLERDDLPQQLIDPETGMLDPAAAENALALLDILDVDADEASIRNSEVWRSDYELEGLWLEMASTMDDADIGVFFVIVDTGDDVFALAALMRPDNLDTFREFTRSVMATARLVEGDE